MLTTVDKVINKVQALIDAEYLKKQRGVKVQSVVAEVTEEEMDFFSNYYAFDIEPIPDILPFRKQIFQGQFFDKGIHVILLT